MIKFLSIAFVIAAMALVTGQDAEACGGDSGCLAMAPGTATAAVPNFAQAQSGVRTTRSFSVEPMMGMRSYATTPSYYFSPMMRSYRTPSYLLPKTDARKFGGR